MPCYADMVELADTPDLGSGAKACRFKSCYPHQTVQIRTLSLLEMGSDLLFFSIILISTARHKCHKAESFYSLPCLCFKPFYWFSVPLFCLFLLPCLVFLLSFFALEKGLNIGQKTSCQYFQFVLWYIPFARCHKASQQLIFSFIPLYIFISKPLS